MHLIVSCSCEIDWKPGKNLTVIMKKKKQRAKGGKQTRTVTKEEPCESFFNFFKPPQIPEDMDDDDDDEDMVCILFVVECYSVLRTNRDMHSRKSKDSTTQGERLCAVH